MNKNVTTLMLSLFILSSIINCSDANRPSKLDCDVASEIESEVIDAVKHQNDTLLIEFDGGIRILWDNVNDTIIKDENYYSICQKPININIVNAISDTSFVSENVCTKHSSLKKGDIAFILLEYSGKITTASFSGQQWDVLCIPCLYPCNQLDWVEDNREYIKETIIKKHFIKDNPHIIKGM